MKATKKLLAILLAAVMLMAVLPGAFADDPAYSLTITGTKQGHTYLLYQIFTGTLTNEGGKLVLTDVKYGNGWTDQTAGTLVPQNVLNEFQTASGETNIEKYLPHMPTVGNGAIATVPSTDGATVFMGLPAGYYLVIEADADNLPVGETMTKHILQVVGDTSVALKASTVSSEKKVKDINDSEGTPSAWQDSADYDIGDDVPFQLSATVSDLLNDYKGPYAMTFHDHQSDGLTFNQNSVEVFVKTSSGSAETRIDSANYTVRGGSESSNSCTFEVHFDNLKNISAVTPGSTIIVRYTSKLNARAKTGAPGNPNEMHITFSNNPNNDNPDNPHEEGETPDDKVTVFTFKLVVNKVQPVGDTQETEPLKGAAFKLSKKNSSGAYVEVETLGTDKDNPIDEFKFTGLDDGDYKLEEVITPDSFNTIAPIEFTITANHEVQSDDPRLTALTGGKLADGNVDIAGDLNTGTITTYVVNIKGKTLPSTGGMGTTVFYIIGSILVVCAGVLLISKKRMNGAK